jgi:hypothetical protein
VSSQFDYLVERQARIADDKPVKLPTCINEVVARLRFAILFGKGRSFKMTQVFVTQTFGYCGRNVQQSAPGFIHDQLLISAIPKWLKKKKGF